MSCCCGFLGCVLQGGLILLFFWSSVLLSRCSGSLQFLFLSVLVFFFFLLLWCCFLCSCFLVEVYFCWLSGVILSSSCVFQRSFCCEAGYACCRWQAQQAQPGSTIKIPLKNTTGRQNNTRQPTKINLHQKARTEKNNTKVEERRKTPKQKGTKIEGNQNTAKATPTTKRTIK